MRCRPSEAGFRGSRRCWARCPASSHRSGSSGSCSRRSGALRVSDPVLSKGVELRARLQILGVKQLEGGERRERVVALVQKPESRLARLRLGPPAPLHVDAVGVQDLDGPTALAKPWRLTLRDEVGLERRHPPVRVVLARHRGRPRLLEPRHAGPNDQIGVSRMVEDGILLDLGERLLDLRRGVLAAGRARARTSRLVAQAADLGDRESVAVHGGVRKEAGLVADLELWQVLGELDGHLGTCVDLDVWRRVQRLVDPHDDRAVVGWQARHGALADRLDGAREGHPGRRDEILQRALPHPMPRDRTRTIDAPATHETATSGMSTRTYSQPISNSPVTTVTRKPSGSATAIPAAMEAEGRSPARPEPTPRPNATGSNSRNTHRR